MNKRNLVLYFSITIILISVAFAVSYAFFNANILGNDKVTTTNVTTGTLTIDFATSAYINNTNLFLISDSDIETKADATKFSISNTNGNVTGKYTISLTDLTISDNLKSADFKWQLLKNNTALATGNFTNATTGTEYSLTTSNQSISVNQTDSYILRIWLSETQQDQLSLTNGTFSAKVKMTAVEG